MKPSELISPGDKIDIMLKQQVEQRKASREDIVVYKSSVMEFLSDILLEILIPSDGGKMILLPSGVRYDFTFYTKKGLYECSGIIKNRYKKDNFYLYAVELTTGLVKIQRREYYRLPCLLGLNYYQIPEGAAEKFDQLSSEAAMLAELSKLELDGKGKRGAIVDISGGGIRYVSKEAAEPDDLILSYIQLEPNCPDKNLYVPGRIVASSRMANDNEKFENRVKFIFKDKKNQEKIIQYIFEKERKTLNKDNR